MKVLFVCSSNICRSPYCEFRFRKIMEENPKLAEKVSEVNSGAVFNISTKLHKKAYQCMLEEGYDESILKAHRAKYIWFNYKMFKDADVIIGMTRWHKWCLPFSLRKKYINLSEVGGGEYFAIPDPFLAKSQVNYNKCMEIVGTYVDLYASTLTE